MLVPLKDKRLSDVRDIVCKGDSQPHQPVNLESKAAVESTEFIEAIATNDHRGRRHVATQDEFAKLRRPRDDLVDIPLLPGFDDLPSRIYPMETRMAEAHVRMGVQHLNRSFEHSR